VTAPKLTEDQVRQILASKESGFVLAKAFGVSFSVVAAVRSRQTWRRIDMTPARAGPSIGEFSASAKLTEEKVRQIRATSGTLKQVAEWFGVSPATINDIRQRKTWKHI
jgi:hypothetical protein